MATPKTNDPMQEMVSVHVPKITGEEPMLLVGLNGKLYNIPRGKTSMVPKPVADIIAMSDRNAGIADEYSERGKALLNQVQGAPV